MKPLVSIIMGSTSDLPVMEKACKWLDDNEIPFEVNALSAHRTPDAVEAFAKGAKARGVKVIIAAAGMAAALPGVIAASTPLPVIGVPIKGMLDGLDAMLSIIQMPPGIPVATVGVNGAQNAAILAAQMIALNDENVAAKVDAWKAGLGEKIEKAIRIWPKSSISLGCSIRWIYSIFSVVPRPSCMSVPLIWVPTTPFGCRA